MKKLREIMDNMDEGKYSSLEIVMAGIILLLAGVIVGFLISPKKKYVFGPNTENINNLYDDEDDDDFMFYDEDDDFIDEDIEREEF